MNIILKLNWNYEKFNITMEKNIYYLDKVHSTSLKSKEDYTKLPTTMLIKFNKEFVDKINKPIFDKYYYRNDYNNILSYKKVVLNINIFECMNECYNGTYKDLIDSKYHELMLLCALVVVDDVDKFQVLVDEMDARIGIKTMIKGAIIVMMLMII